MLTTLAVLAVLLGLATAANLLLTFAVIRRLRALEETGGGGPRPDSLPAAGTAVADFAALTTAGEPLTLSDLAARGDAVVGFVRTGCGPCHRLIVRLAGRDADAARAQEPLFFVVGEDGADEEAMAMAAKLGAIGRVALIAPQSEVAAAFGAVHSFPTLLRLQGGVVVAAGRDLRSVERAKEMA